MIDSRQIRRAKERAEAKAKRKQHTNVVSFNLNKINTNNKNVLADLNNPELGFYCAYKWKTKDGDYDTGKFSVYMPSLDESDLNYVDPDEMPENNWTKHLEVYQNAFGLVEAGSYAIVKHLEDHGSTNPYTGDKTYEPFNGGAYKLGFGVWEPSNTEYTFGGSDNVDIPIADVIIFPMLQHDWETPEAMAFKPAFGGDVMLDNLHSMIARANFCTTLTMPHNPNRFENCNKLLQQPFSSPTNETLYNWIMQYTASYQMYRSTLGGGNGFSDVKVEVGGHNNVTGNSAMNLHKAMD